MDYFKEEELALPNLRIALETIERVLGRFDNQDYRRWLRSEIAIAEKRGFRDYAASLERRRALAEDTPSHVTLGSLAEELRRKIRGIEDREEETTYLKGIFTLIQKYDGRCHDPNAAAAAADAPGLGNFGFKRSIVCRKGGFFNDYVAMTTGVLPASGGYTDHQGTCRECGAPTTHIKADASIVCTECGLTGNACDTSLDAVPFVDRPPNISATGYKRINHFNEWLAQLQAKGSTEIHPQIIEDVTAEFTKRRRKASEVTPDRVRKYLKVLGYTNYYEHEVQIASTISGTPPPYFTPQQEERLRIMFKLCQVPFDECPKRLKKDPATNKIRKNFPSYSYTLYKFCELMGYDDFLRYFKLLKSPKNLEQHDRMWEYFCSRLGWQYFPSSCMVSRPGTRCIPKNVHSL